MALVDSGIALSVRPSQVESPLDVLGKGISIQDSLAQLQERQAQAKDYAAQAPLRQAQAANAMQSIAEKKALDQAFENSVSYDQEAGDLKYDDAKAADILHSSQIPGVGAGDYLLPQYQAQKDQRLTAHRQQAIGELDQANTVASKVAVPVKNFLATEDPDKKAAAWPDLRASLIAMNPAIGKQLPPDYDPEVVDPKLQATVQHAENLKDTHQKLTDAQDESKLQTEQDLQAVKSGKLTRQQYWEKLGNTVGSTPPAQWTASLNAQLSGLKEPPAAAYSTKKLAVTTGDKAAADATDIDGNPIPESWREPGIQLDLMQGGPTGHYYVPTPGWKPNVQQTKDSLNQAAYAASLGKEPGELSDSEKFQANVWAAKQTPQRMTDWQRKAELFKTNPQAYADMTGHLLNGQVKPLTSAERATALSRINAATLKQFPHSGDPKDPDFQAAKDFRSQQIQQYKDAGLDLTSAPSKIPPAQNPATPAPKTGAPVYKKGTSQILGYFDGYDAAGKVKIRPNP